MKKIIFLLFISCFGFAQEKFETYSSKVAGKDFDVLVSKEKNLKLKFWVSTYSIDATSKDCLLIIEEDNVKGFVEYLDFLKLKFNEWKKTAIDNNVQDLNKEINGLDKTFGAGFQYGKWQFDFDVKLSSKFTILKGSHYITIKSGELLSSSNQYIKSNGFVIFLSSDEEFDKLKNSLNIDKAKDFFLKKESKEDLFKN